MCGKMVERLNSDFFFHYLTALTRRSRIEVPRVDYEKLSADRVGESSESIGMRVQAARDIQTKRYSSIRNSNNELSAIVCKADMRVAEIRQFCKVQEEGQRLMRAATSCCS
jgi:magnesium chelatase family protein